MDDRYRVVTGIAGAGKTTFAMDLLLQALKDGLDWSQVGFLSFSRAACGEATRRAAIVTGESEDRLTKWGWFRTIHSAAARAAGIDTRLILDAESADGKEWYEQRLGTPRGGERGTHAARVAAVLDRWDLARQTLSLLKVPPPAGGEKSACDTCDTCDTLRQVDFACVRAGEMQRKDWNFDVATRVFLSLYGISKHVKPGTIVKNTCRTCRRIYKSIYREDLGAHTSECDRCRNVSHMSQDFAGHWAAGVDNCEWADEIADKFEQAKRLYSMVDFTDLLMQFVGLRMNGLEMVGGHPVGVEPDDVRLWLVDEAQDCSPLLWAAVDRLCGTADQVILLGDPYQAVYRFLGADPDILLDRQEIARQRGDWTLLNRSWRNPQQVLEWGEAVLATDPVYRSREPVSESGEGSAALMDWTDFQRALPLLARLDCLILARTWFGLQDVQSQLNGHGVPWSSVTEKHRSTWDSPVRLAVVLTCRDLAAGLPISEQDWRRLMDAFPVKWENGELFQRGQKAKWKKVACSGEPQLTLAELEKWGAGDQFGRYIQDGHWKNGQYAVLDWAIEKWGVDLIRKPRVRLGTVHSVKGLEAQVVFCMAASTQASAAGDSQEETNLKYVAVTRASMDYRLVVNQADHVRGRPMFWAAPKSARWDNSTEWINERIEAAERDPEMAREPGLLGDEMPSGGDGEMWTARPDRVLLGDDDRLRSESPRGQGDGDAGGSNAADFDEWWSM